MPSRVPALPQPYGFNQAQLAALELKEATDAFNIQSRMVNANKAGIVPEQVSTAAAGAIADPVLPNQTAQYYALLAKKKEAALADMMKAVAEAGKSANAQTRELASISRGNARGGPYINPGYSNIRPIQMARPMYARGGSRRRQRKSKKSRKHRNKKTRRN